MEQPLDFKVNSFATSMGARKSVSLGTGYLLGAAVAIGAGIPPEIGGVIGSALTVFIEWIIERFVDGASSKILQGI